MDRDLTQEIVEQVLATKFWQPATVNTFKMSLICLRWCW